MGGGAPLRVRGARPEVGALRTAAAEQKRHESHGSGGGKQIRHTELLSAVSWTWDRLNGAGWTTPASIFMWCEEYAQEGTLTYVYFLRADRGLCRPGYYVT